jgi:hypothetical protein
MNQNDEFYIGYEGAMPSGMAAAVRTAVVLAAAAAVLMAIVFTVSQRPLAASRFEFGRARSVEGYLRRLPSPALLVREGGGWRRFWLVSTGKFGVVTGRQKDGWVRLTGTLIEREHWSMLEVQPGSIEASGALGETPPPDTLSIGRPATFTGEIVDSKCFLGVMNPGERTVHRDCASRCLSGGIPAMFAFRDADGRTQLALLLTADGLPAGHRLLDWTGRPVRLTGLLAGSDDALTFTLETGN